MIFLLNGYSGYNQIFIYPEDQKRLHLHVLMTLLHLNGCRFDYVMHQIRFNDALRFHFSDMVMDTMEVCMDDVSVVGHSFYMSVC